MNTWLLPRIDLTSEQLRAVRMSPYENRIVSGVVGSGKTQIMVYRAAHLVKKFQVPPDRYRVFVFTNVVKEYIKSGLQFLNLPEESVCTFDHWCRLLYEDYVSYNLPKRVHNDEIDFRKIRFRVLELLRRRKGLQHNLEFVLVDEGQDLNPEVYEILSLASRHVTVFVDPQQKIFEEGADVSFILKTLKIKRRNAIILGAYRNAPSVACLASNFILDSDRKLKKQYLAQVCAAQKVRERPLCFVASSYEKEMDRLAEIVRQRQIMNERVGIIVPTNRLLDGIATELEERGVMVEKAIKPDSKQMNRVKFDFGNTLPKIATFHMAKGLTFDSVLLPHLAENCFPWTKGVARQRILFVGIARAAQWVYMSTVRGREFTEMEILRKAEAEGHLTIQYRYDFEGVKKEKAQEGQPGDEFSIS